MKRWAKMKKIKKTHMFNKENCTDSITLLKRYLLTTAVLMVHATLTRVDCIKLEALHVNYVVLMVQYHEH